MPFDAKVFRILVASPGDVGDERQVIPEVINEWNTVSSLQTKSILMPVKWESHSAPLLGNRPQAIINEQLVNDCDLLVGVFWTRIGTNTGVAVSGTVEEIERFIAMGKPVMLYFSQSPIDPDKIDIDQFSSMRKFKEKVRLQGLTESYSGIADFRHKFSRQLSINLTEILNRTAIEIEEKSRIPGSDEPLLTIVPQLPNSSIYENKAESLSAEQVNEILVESINSVAGSDGWAPVAGLGKYLKTYTSLDYKSLGYDKLNKFLESRKIFEIRNEQKSARAKAVDSAYVRVMQ